MIKRQCAVRFVIGVLILGTAGCSVRSAPNLEGSAASPAAPAIRSFAEAEIDKEGHVGATLAVWHDGKVMFHDNWGMADLDAQAPVTDDTLFFAASLLKEMTGYLALLLAEDGELDLDAAIQNYLPDFPAHSSGKSPTIRQLLLHRGGIRHYIRLQDGWSENAEASFYDKHFETATEALSHWLDNDRLFYAIAAHTGQSYDATKKQITDAGLEFPYLFPPGEGHRYTSFGYTIVAAAIESVAGKPFSEVLEERVFAPFGMTTAIQPDMRYPIPHYAKSYMYESRRTGETASDRLFRARTLDFSYNAGGGNLATTVLDLINWGKQFVDGGDANQAVREMVLSSEHFVNDEKTEVEAYGMSLFQDRAGRWIIHNCGGSEAYIGCISIWPDDRLVVASYANSWTKNSREGGFGLELARSIGELLLD